MIYNNLIYLLVVILVFATSSIPDSPQFSASSSFFLFTGKLFLYFLFIRSVFSLRRIRGAQQYFSAERKSSILAIALIGVDVYFLDFKYYIAELPFTSQFPSLVDFSGIALFFLYLAIIWFQSARCYRAIFLKEYTRRSFLTHNIKLNLPIILPWLLLSFCADLLQMQTSIPMLKDFLSSTWGQPTVLLTFFLLLAIGFPAIITRLWNCVPLPPGETRKEIEDFCEKQNLRYNDIMLWPLFEGQVLTAGVMGLVKRFRYLLVTPALLATMTPVEVEAVIAHEIGHVKRYHLPLYLLLFLGFGMLAQFSAYPFLYLLLNSDMFYEAARLAGKEPGEVLSFASTVPMILLMVLYFRYIFGFYMRNFERQADIHALTVMKTAAPLVRVLEKIAMLSGNIRDLPSWHHFGIGQRVDYLKKCEQDPVWIKRHNRKVNLSLLFYAGVLSCAIILLLQIPDDLLDGAPRDKFAEAVITQKIDQEPGNSIWYQLLGDLQHGRKHYKEAIWAYEKSLELTPYHPDILNNFAWLLLSAEDPQYRDPDRALVLARDAAKIKKHGYILDTLATAYWQNGFVELARLTEEKAIAIDPENKKYYMEKLEKFESSPGEE